jgi:gliding motility-associated-like protein
VLIRESGVCTSAPITAIISQPALLSMPVPITSSVICNGSKTGRIVVSPSGGTWPYSYSTDNFNFIPDSIFNVGAGNYTVYIRDASGCRIQTNPIAVTEPAVLNAVVAGTTNATCSGGNDGAISINVTGGMLPYSYSPDGNNFQSVNRLNVKNGIYDITVKDANDCRFIIPGVNVGLTDNLTLNVANPQPICEGTSVQLQAAGNANKFSWIVAGTSAEIAAVNNPVLSPRTSTIYTVMASLGNCRRSLDVLVPVLPAPVANAGGGNEICFGQDYQLQGSGGVGYSWSPVTYLNDPRSPNPLVIRPAQTTTYSLRVTDNNNCQSIDASKVLVTVTPPIKVTISPTDTVVSPGAQFQLIASSAGNNYSWSPAGMLSNSGINAPIVTAGVAGTTITYTVIASTDAGCQGEGTAVVKVYNGPDIYVPNAFSPNGDGKNEEFYPFPVGIKQIKYFRVFNRWGQLLFATTTIYKGWNGKMGGREQANGVYVWTFEGITSENRVISRSGTVTLIR